MSEEKKVVPPICLSLDDKACIRRAVAIGANAAGGRGGGYSITKSGFNGLVASLCGDRMAEIKAENEGAMRYAAIVGKTFQMPDATAGTTTTFVE